MILKPEHNTTPCAKKREDNIPHTVSAVFFALFCIFFSFFTHKYSYELPKNIFTEGCLEISISHSQKRFYIKIPMYDRVSFKMQCNVWRDKLKKLAVYFLFGFFFNLSLSTQFVDYLACNIPDGEREKQRKKRELDTTLGYRHREDQVLIAISLS